MFEKRPPGYQPEQEPTSCTVEERYTFRGVWLGVDHLNATLRIGMHVRCGDRRWRIAKIHAFACPLEGRKYLRASLLLDGPPEDLPNPGDVLEFDEAPTTTEAQLMTEKVAYDGVSEFPLYAPNSAGSRADIEILMRQCINEVFPALANLCPPIGRLFTSEPALLSQPELGERLAAAFTAHGSDKSTYHDYHIVYSHLLPDPDAVRGIVEIGLGTNNTDVPSHMGAGGAPGASLRAFREVFPKAEIFGGDVDRRILFQEGMIRTAYVDQSANNFQELRELLFDNIDLVIDDGLHSPLANLHTLIFGLTVVRPGGHVVIEDIKPEASPFWEIVASLIRPTHPDCTFIHARGGCLFVVKN